MMGTSITMVDDHYSHLRRNPRSRDSASSRPATRPLDASWTQLHLASRPQNPQALCRTRTDDPLLTMEGQRLAVDGAEVARRGSAPSVPPAQVLVIRINP